MSPPMWRTIRLRPTKFSRAATCAAVNRSSFGRSAKAARRRRRSIISSWAQAFCRGNGGTLGLVPIFDRFGPSGAHRFAAVKGIVDLPSAIDLHEAEDEMADRG